MASIRKRNSKWVVDFRIGSDRKRETFNTRADAEQFKRSLLLRPIDRVTQFQEIKELTLKEALEKYLAQVVPTKAPRTQDGDKHVLKLLMEKYGDMQLHDMKLMQLEAYQLHLSRTYLPTSVNRHFNVIRHFFRKCEDWELIQQNPTRRLKNLKGQSKEKRLWRQEEVEKFFAHAPSWLQDIALFVYETGVRRGEAVSLLWKDVDFEKGAVRIRSIKGGIARERNIPMTASMRDWLLSLKNKRPFLTKANNHVFLGEDNLPLDAIFVSTHVHRIVRRLKMDGLGLHGMRHTLLTELVQSDVSLEKVRQIAGHSNLKTTEQYLHIKLDDTRNVLELSEERRKILRPSFGRKS